MKDASYKHLRNYCYFTSCSDYALQTIADKFRRVELAAGTTIVGYNAPADSIYLISKGNVEVQKKTEMGEITSTSIEGNGMGFGKMPLFTCSSRDCTAVAKSSVSLFKLLRSDFDEILQIESSFGGSLYRSSEGSGRGVALKTFKPFTLLAPEMVLAVSSKFTERRYSADEDIIKAGEPGHEYFMIKSGMVHVWKKNLEDEFVHVATLEEGQAFGEEALITNSPRNATVRAVNETVVLVLAREDFEAIMKSSFLREVTAEDVLGSKDKNCVLLDVRMHVEFEEEHIPGAIHIPLDELRTRYHELQHDKNYFVYCRSGRRSLSAAYLMNIQGFRAQSVKGGITKWPGAIVNNTKLSNPAKPT
jgi:CRP-like cAMP-binding protein